MRMRLCVFCRLSFSLPFTIFYLFIPYPWMELSRKPADLGKSGVGQGFNGWPFKMNGMIQID